MEQITLFSARRTIKKGAAKELRQQGQVPCILYGHGFETVPIQIEALELSRVLTQAGSSQLINLKIDDALSTQPVLAREIQRNVLTGQPIHVDFLAVSMTEKISAEVAITLIGEPEAVARGEGILLQGINSVEIECLPGDLIPSLEVDVSKLDFDHAIYVSDLNVSAEITILSDAQEMVAQVVPEQLPEMAEEEEAGLFAEEPARVEVISRGKDEEE